MIVGRRLRRRDEALPRPRLEAREPRRGGDRRHAGKLLALLQRRDAERLQAAGRDVRARGRVVDEHDRHGAAEQVLHGRRRAAIGDLVELDAGRLLEQHGGEMERIADARMRDVDLARLGLRGGDQLGDRVHLQLVRVHQQHADEARRQRDRREVLLGIERDLLVEALVGREGRDVAEQDGVAVRLRLGDEVRAEIGRGARLVLDHDRLADQLLHLLPDEAREEVGPAAGRIRHDQMDRLVGIGLREGGRLRARRRRARRARYGERS